MAKLDLAYIAKHGWLQRWAGSFTFISCSYWGLQYFRDLKKELGLNFAHTLFIHRNGISAFYLPDSEYRRLGKTLADRSIKSYSYARKYCEGMKKNTDILLPMMKKLGRKVPSNSDYLKFLKFYDRHISFQVFVKKTIDFFSSSQLERFGPIFRDARIYSESVYTKSEELYRNFAKHIAKREGYSPDYLTCLTQTEFEEYIKNQKLPDQRTLKKRFEASALYFENGREVIVTGKKVNQIEAILTNQSVKNNGKIKGTTAYPGKVQGVARIVVDPFKVRTFHLGDILITGMTRPEFLPLIKKASAIITDVGGVLCHAAITAREMKKPCVIGTKIATKVLKDGDLVEVDADEGIVKKIS